jgi:hypothetical protein
MRGAKAVSGDASLGLYRKLRSALGFAYAMWTSVAGSR